jgi:low temperature requirement protein LtrA
MANVLPTESEDGNDAADSVSPVELFFDLVFVFAFVQVTTFLAADVTWVRVARAIALLAVLWWGWVTYTWLTDALSTEENVAERVVIFAATAGMFIVALAVPTAFEEGALLFAVAYFVVRGLHVALYTTATTPETRDAILRLAPGFLGGPLLLVVASFLAGSLQAAVWVVALVIDYGVAYVRGVAGFRIHPEHFVDRHRDIVIIALGESVLAMGLGLGNDVLELPPESIVAAFLGIILAAGLAWLYFDYVTLAMEENLVTADPHERAKMARDTYSYLHFPIVTGIIFVAFGLKKTVAHPQVPLETIPAVALCGGGALYLFGDVAARLRDVGIISKPRLVVAILACVISPRILEVPSLTALVGVLVLFVALAAYETIYSEYRHSVRGT